MDKHAANIKNRLSLRSPQTESLKILAEIADTLSLKKDADLAAEQEKILTYVRAVREPPLQQSVFTDFERNFPCVCFAVATGVGKTRLMGAFITWLNQAKGIKNFFVLAPKAPYWNSDDCA